MLHASYEVWGVVIIGLLVSLWILRGIIRHKKADDRGGLNRLGINSRYRDHDIEHRALMFLMTQKTDSVLAAMSNTIAQERQKLGVIVRNPSMSEAVDAFQADAMPINGLRCPPYDRILPMAHDGIAMVKIARQLQLPEAEVDMVLRLNAA